MFRSSVVIRDTMQGTPSDLRGRHFSPLPMQPQEQGHRGGVFPACHWGVTLEASPHRFGYGKFCWYETGSPQSYALECGESLTGPARSKEMRALIGLSPHVGQTTNSIGFCILCHLPEKCSLKGLWGPLSSRVVCRLRELAVVGLVAQRLPPNYETSRAFSGQG